MPPQHRSGVAWEVQAGDCRKDWRMGHGAGEKAVWRKNGEWTGTSRMRSRVAKKLDEQRRKLQKELRDIDKFSCVCRKSFRKTSRVTCNSSCKRWSKGGMTSCQNTRKCRRYRKKIQSIQDRRRNLQGIETDLSIQLPKSTSDGRGMLHWETDVRKWDERVFC